MKFFLPLLAAAYVQAFPTFVGRLPNGGSVPNPCLSNSIWTAVGHQRPDGTGGINQLGLDFRSAGYTWTAAFCNLDSDGDGLTNGQELGDPNCVWQVGQGTLTRLPISNPGICEPVNSGICLNAVNNQFLRSITECQALLASPLTSTSRIPFQNQSGLLIPVLASGATAVPVVPRPPLVVAHSSTPVPNLKLIASILCGIFQFKSISG